MLMNILLSEPDWLMILYDNFNQSRTEIPRDAYKEREREREPRLWLTHLVEHV